MSRDEYLQILRDNLTTMSDNEKDDVIRYYLEYFIDSGDEQAAMEELGRPEKLADRLCGTNNYREVKSHNERVNGTYPEGGTAYKANGTQYSSGYNDGNSDEYGTEFGSYNAGAGYGTDKKKRPAWLIILMICTSPVWLPLAIAAGAVVLALVIVAAALVFSFFITFGALAVAGVVCLIASVAAFAKSFADGIVVLGVGLMSLGVGIVLFLLRWWVWL